MQKHKNKSIYNDESFVEVTESSDCICFFIIAQYFYACAPERLLSSVCVTATTGFSGGLYTIQRVWDDNSLKNTYSFQGITLLKYHNTFNINVCASK